MLAENLPTKSPNFWAKLVPQTRGETSATASGTATASALPLAVQPASESLSGSAT